MTDRVGMGVVGAGSIGIRAALAHLSLPDVQDRVTLAAVCDQPLFRVAHPVPVAMFPQFATKAAAKD